MGAPVRVGDLLADKYEVTRILGQGGMGVVVAARHRELDKLVALKFMHEEVAANATAIDRFLREAKAAARLQNEHIGRVLDVGRLHNGVPYIVLEYLEGRDLSDVVADAGGALPVSEVCEYILQTCEAMAEAHAAGIIHRDLKPQNLFLTMRPDGRPLIKVLDFGISKVQASTGPTATQQTMGTPAYMSPEQMRSAKSCDGRADIWSLGVILYQLLGGTMPFVGESIAETMLKVMTDSYPPLAQVRPGLPPALVAAVDKCLRKSRDERFDNVAELAHELTPFAPERARAAMHLIERVMSAGVAQPAQSVVDHELASVVPSANTSAPRSLPPVAQTTLGGAASAMSLELRPTKSSPVKWIALSVAAVAAAVVVTVMLTRTGGNTSETPTAASPGSGVVEPKPKTNAEPQLEPKPETKVEPTEPKPEPKIEAKPEPKPSKPEVVSTPANKKNPRPPPTKASDQTGPGSGKTGSNEPTKSGSDTKPDAGSGDEFVPKPPRPIDDIKPPR